MNEWSALGPADEKLTQEAAEVAVTWVLAGQLTDERSKQLIVGDHLRSHSWMGEADWVHRWERSFLDALATAADSEEGRQLVAAAKDTALRDMQSHMYFELDQAGWLGPTPGHQRVCASLRRIIATGPPKAP
ncbi:hypothetical protein [Streptomyces sp. W1SF4]|uniref:hypothetical protein n=1 Tax=Streptomyces sp. W1SF4 TaxID=2305220 RepID=UPI000F6E5482|nr:hypothetical protein [Streptomyces sp. W1SF4]AZM93837.1 hypothetical protein D1J60_35580 [Streptomyces sp. W1SF4]